MSFLDKFFRARGQPDQKQEQETKQEPKKQTSGGVYIQRYGRTKTGVVVTEKTALQVSVVVSCIKVLAEAVAVLPLHVYEYTEDGQRHAVKHPLYFLLHDEPNEEMTSFTFRETLMTHLLLWGNAYCHITRNNRGAVTGIYPLMPNRMTVERDKATGGITYKYLVSSEDPKKLGNHMATIPNHEILHIPAMGFDGLVGYSPIAMSKESIGLSLAMEQYASSFFENDATPRGILSHPTTLDEESKENIQKGWLKIFGGGSNSHKTAVLEEGMTFSAIQSNPKDSQLLEVRKFQINEIARIFRIPPHMVGDLEKSSFSNIEQQSLEFVMHTLEPWIVRLEQSFAKALFTRSERGKYSVKFNVDGLLRGDYASRMSGYAIGRQNGWLSVNDIRRLENMNLIPEEEGGNAYLVNGNMVKMSQPLNSSIFETGGVLDG